MLFRDIIGQDELKKKLIQTFKENRVSHAQLFAGPDGSGALPLAFAYTQFVNCDNQQENDSCGVCPSCNKIQKLIYADLHFTYPTVSPHKVSTELIEEWRKAFIENPYMNVFQWLQFLEADNKQGNITADECRDVIKKLSLKSLEGKFKIHIMWMPEYLRHEGNILLKLLEEPPEHTLIILVTEDQDKILPTILSRTQLIKINRLKDEELAAALIERHSIDPETAQTITRLAEGNYNKALTLMEEENNDFLEIFRNWMNMCVRQQSNDLVRWVDEFSGSGREILKNFLSYGLYLLRESFMMGIGSENLSRLNDQEREFASKFAKAVNENNLPAMSSEINEAIQYIERNANPKIILINLSLQIGKQLRNKTVQEARGN